MKGYRVHHTKAIFYFPEIGMADTQSLFGAGIVCDVWVDIASVVEKKIRAIDQPVSQGAQRPAARKIVEARDGRWGMLAGCSYKILYERLKPIRCSLWWGHSGVILTRR